MDRRRWIVRTALVACATAVAFGVPELALRLRAAVAPPPTLRDLLSGIALPEPGSTSRWLHALVPVDDERIGYALRPHFDAYVRMADRRVRLTVNAHGFRGPDVAHAKAPGTVRIVGIGDSMMMGHGLAHEETYLHRLEQLLERRYRELDVEVVNLAVGGYDAVQEIETLRQRGLAYHPDIVLWHAVSNDHHGIQYDTARVDPWALDRCFFFDAIAEAAQPERTGPFEGWRHVRRSLEELAALRERHGFELLFYSHEDTPANERLLAIARELGLDPVDLRETLPAQLERRLLLPSALKLRGDGHPSALHNEIIADDLHRALVARGTLERLANER